MIASTRRRTNVLPIPVSLTRLGVVVIAAVAGAVVIAFLAVRATAAAAPFSLTFEGAHFADSSLLHGLRHDGRFTASAPFCPAGRAHDVRHFEGDPLTVLRVHTCDDGSGSFTAFMPIVRNEHHGEGTWSIVEGTGRFATLRGHGTYTGTLVSGDPLLYDTIAYRTDWQGVVGFDADPPAVELLTAAARRLRAGPRTYVMQVSLAVADASAPVSYAVDVRAGRAGFASKQGSMSSGRVTITFRLRPAQAVRTARIVLTAEDALGNVISASRSVGLR